MKRVLLVLFLAWNTTAYAWNGTGHKAIALIAYERLTPAAKQRIDQILAQHPDYPKWIAGVSADDRGRAAFLAAAVWPDAIRSDPRFHGDNRRPTPPIPGLPAGAQARHADWHFINMPFSPDGTPTVAAPPSNIVTKLQEFANIGRMPAQQQVYVLPWLLHLVGDIHQPMHVLQRFTEDFPRGDRGGNSVRLRGTSNLHSYWDSRLGTSQTERFLAQLAETIERRHPAPRQVDMNPAHWAEESFKLQDEVYALAGRGTTESPAVLSDVYAVQARGIAYARAAMAGYRLAELLNEQFR